MKQDDKNQDIERRIGMEASDWVIKCSDEMSAADQDAFFQWLAEDPRHGEQFARYKRKWRDFGLLAEWRPEHSMEPNPDLLDSMLPARPWLSWGVGAAALAACLAMAFLLLSGLNRNGSEPLRLVAEDYLYQVLDDGSEIDMREGSVVLVDYSTGLRRIELVSGEAHFLVAKNPNRPFVVEAGSASFRAVGTAFNVKLNDEEVSILVTEGKVQLNRESPASQSDMAREVDGKDLAIRVGSILDSGVLGVGQYSAISLVSVLDEPIVRELASEEIEARLSWKHELLDFDSAPLSEVVAAFNRRNQMQLSIQGEALENETVVAVVRSNEIEDLIRMLELSMDIDVVREGGERIVLVER